MILFNDIDMYKLEVEKKGEAMYDSEETIDFNYAEYEYIDILVDAIDTLEFKITFNMYGGYSFFNKEYFIEKASQVLKSRYNFNWNINFIDSFEFYYNVLLYFEYKIYNDIRLAAKQLKTRDVIKITNYVIEELLSNDIVYSFLGFQDIDFIIEFFEHKMSFIKSDIELLLIKNKHE